MSRLRSTACLLTVLLASTSLTACTKKPSEEQCGEFADHMVELLQASREKPSSKIQKMAQDKRQDIISKCVGDGSVEEVECVLAQESLEDLAANCK